jgi:low affinity Fe/Cu permease
MTDNHARQRAESVFNREQRRERVARRRPRQHLHRGNCTHHTLGRQRPVFWYSDTWQLVINSGTTIITFLMVFLFQNSQNRDTAAIQVKLDELIRASDSRNTFVGIEHLTEQELEELRAKFEQRAKAEAVRTQEDASSQRTQREKMRS